MPDAATRNPRSFLWFRVFFNCRFYYAIYAILFLDFGLSASQFAILNAVWAAAIILLEVPSGALADQIGRKNLVVVSAILMVAEIAVICFTPINAAWTFPLLILNRLLSGAAEAAASGADEALAYEAMPENDRDEAWSHLTGKVMKITSFGMMLTMVTGAFLYDASAVSKVLAWIGINADLQPGDTLKWPLYLNAITAVGALIAALSFSELREKHDTSNLWVNVRLSFARTLETGKWILRTPAPLVLIMVGILIDGALRLLVTNASQYYRLVEIPTTWFGVLGAAAAGIGIFSAAFARRRHSKSDASSNFRLTWILAMLTLSTLAYPIKYCGALALFPSFIAMQMLGYFLSQHLNAVTPSDKRATALSFKGLSMNLAFGGAMLIYWLQSFIIQQDNSDTDLKQFSTAIQWWPLIFFVASILVWIWIRSKFGKSMTAMISDAKQRLATKD